MRRMISIHAPHEGERPGRVYMDDAALVAFQSTLPTRGSDIKAMFGQGCTVHISIHAPHEGERHSKIKDGKSSKLFQSTLPTRGSDVSYIKIFFHGGNFNPRSPRGGATAEW